MAILKVNTFETVPELTEALKNRKPMTSEKLKVLRESGSKSWTHNTGEFRHILKAGYGEQQVLEVISGLFQKVISNYITNTPVDKKIQKFA